MAKLAPLGKYRAFDANGLPLAGGKLETYEAGTSTPKPTFTTEAGDVANDNPVILDAEGYADIWLESGSYKFVLKDSNDVLIFTTDDIVGEGTGGYASSVVEQSDNLVLTGVYQNNVICCTASLTISLLAAASAGEGFVFTVKNESSGNVTIDPDGSEEIDGSSTLVIGPGLSANIVCTGSAWKSFNFATVSSDGDNSFEGSNTFNGDVSLTKKLQTPDSGELVISVGEITPTGVYHTVDTEADAGTDDLDTILGGVDGQLLVIHTEDNARDVTLTNAGNISTPSAVDITLSATTDVATLLYDATAAKWVVVSAPVAPASETVAGVISIATDAEVKTGTESEKATPPSAINAHEGVSKAWINFNGEGTISTRDSYNVTGIADNGTGLYTVTWDTDFANANYCVTFGGRRDDTGASGQLIVNLDRVAGSQAAGSVRVRCGTGSGNTDFDIVCIDAKGDQ